MLPQALQSLFWHALCDKVTLCIDADATLTGGFRGILNDKMKQGSRSSSRALPFVQDAAFWPCLTPCKLQQKAFARCAYVRSAARYRFWHGRTLQEGLEACVLAVPLLSRLRWLGQVDPSPGDNVVLVSTVFWMVLEGVMAGRAHLLFKFGYTPIAAETRRNILENSALPEYPISVLSNNDPSMYLVVYQRRLPGSCTIT